MNLYDDVRLDVSRLIAEQEAKLPKPDSTARSADGLGIGSRLGSLLRRSATALAVKTGLRARLVYANLRLDWFREFQEYWVTEMGNRPILPIDFSFLYGVYRQRLQTIRFPELENPELASDAKHFEAWQDSRLVHHLFRSHYRLALNPLRVYRFVRFIPRGGNVCEYGCGLAPFTTSLVRYYRHRNLRITCADIPNLMLHFARWKFRDCRFIRALVLNPDDDNPLDEIYDVIVCVETLEHLPRPLAVLRHLHSALGPGGYLIFDYLRSEGKGLDTAAALRDRIPALEFVLAHFTVVQGEVPLDGRHVNTVVCQKR